MIQKYFDIGVKILRWGIAAVIVIAPFYAPMVIWLSTDVHHLDLLRAWKEIALVFLSFIILFLFLDYQRVFKDLPKRPLLILAGLYSLLVIGYGVWDLLGKSITSDAVAYGLLTDLRPVAVLTVAVVTFTISQHKRFGEFPWQKIVIIPAFVVIGFGLLQMTVLPKDFLRHVGYSQSTVVPYQTVDNQLDIVRVQSTARGPNPLGAYLVVIIVLFTELFIESKGRRRLYWGVAIGCSLVVLYGTYSRSAEAGLLLAWLALALIHYRQFLRQNLAPLAGVVLLTASLLFIFRNTYLVQNDLFHTSNRSRSPVSSNAERTQAIKSGLEDVWHDPLGRGVGTAGPASLRNRQAPPRIAENYYVQIGQEVGWLGVILFVAINIRLVQLLWRDRQNMLPRVLLASLVGLTFVNMVSHAWTDDTLAYVWWGLAGIAVAPIIVRESQRKAQKA